MHLSRRLVLLGGGVALMAPPALAKGRSALEGGGSVEIPTPYRVATDYPNKGESARPALAAYRNWRSTMSGHPDCDGLLVVGRTDQFESLSRFVGLGRAALSISWGAADLVPGSGWGKPSVRYQAEASDGKDGPELVQQLAVHRVGWLDVYDEPAWMYAVSHRLGVSVGVWIFQKHGGLKKARSIADKLAKSWRA